MLNYIIRRLLMIPILLFGISVMVFFMISVLSPLERASAFFYYPESKKLRHYDNTEALGLNIPMHEQYLSWVLGTPDPETGERYGGLVRGNLGFSETGKMSVTEVISNRLPITLELLLWSTIPMVGFALWMGIKAAKNHNKFIDQLFRITAIVSWSIPAFVIGMLLLLVFYCKLDWFPPGRLSLDYSTVIHSDTYIIYTKMFTIDALLNSRFDIFLDALKHLVLPVITLSISNWAFLLRVTRSSMLVTLQEDYINTARSKGLSEKYIVKKHAAPNAMIPVITVGAVMFSDILNSMVVTETIFNYPGLGLFLTQAAIGFDLVSVAGVIIFSSFILILGNLIVDVLYGVIDPRIRLY